MILTQPASLWVERRLKNGSKETTHYDTNSPRCTSYEYSSAPASGPRWRCRSRLRIQPSFGKSPRYRRFGAVEMEALHCLVVSIIHGVNEGIHKSSLYVLPSALRACMQSTKVHNEVGIWFLLGGNAECMLGENEIISYAHVCSHVLRLSPRSTNMLFVTLWVLYYYSF